MHDRQGDALLAAGVKSEDIYRDKVSGAKFVRAGLEELLGKVREGDAIVVVSVDRLGRSLSQIVALADDLHRRGVTLRSLKESIDYSTPWGACWPASSAASPSKRELINERAADVRAAAKARGKRSARTGLLIDCGHDGRWGLPPWSPALVTGRASNMGRGKGSGSSFGVAAHTGWLRLDHGSLALPLPSVYVPADDLYQRDLPALGFTSAMDTADGSPVGVCRHMVADVADPDRLALMVSRHPLYEIGASSTVEICEDLDIKHLTGSYTEPADRVWQRAAQKAGAIIVIAGPRPAAPGSTEATSLLERLVSRETVFGLLFAPATVMAVVGVASSRG